MLATESSVQSNDMHVHAEDILSTHHIQATAMRLLVMSAIIDNDGPVSLNELETALETVDKSTISRALNLFSAKGALREINDGNGSRRYCICKDAEGHSSGSHVHFTCIKCHRTVCIESVQVPSIELPEGYKISEQSYLIKGICPDCE